MGNWMLNQVICKLDLKQFGSLRGRSTSHALVDLIHTWCQTLEQSQVVRLVFIDFYKAFDRVDHTTVVKNLVDLGIPGSLLKWLVSFLANRRQRVKIATLYSSWLELNGGMPQGTWFGPFAFIILIDRLKLSCLTHKYVDDVTMTEVISKNESSRMNFYLNELYQWSSSNHMTVNESKSKEMIITLSHSITIPTMLQIERVEFFKLLGVIVSNDLKWNRHINFICNKANSRLHFLRQLKRAAVSNDDMFHFYISVIRPVLEYAAPAWHTSLTGALSDQIEAVQKRALRLIYGSSLFSHRNYESFCSELGISTLRDRREDLCKSFFMGLLDPNSCLHHLVPNRKDSTSLLRNSFPYQIPFARTNRYKNSFILYALRHYVL